MKESFGFGKNDIWCHLHLCDALGVGVHRNVFAVN